MIESASDVPYAIVVPSFNRPQQLCLKTLKFLRCQGIDDSRIVVFVTPGTVPGEQECEWNRYRDALNEHGFEGIRRELGGHGLDRQMWEAMRYVGTGNCMVCMTDDTKGIKYKSCTDVKTLSSIPPGGLRGLIALGWHMMSDLKISAWGLNCSSNICNMHPELICRLPGLLEGNCYGQIVSLQPHMEYTTSGVVCDHETTCRIWTYGDGAVRLRMLCSDHLYRTSGGYQIDHSTRQRKGKENEAIDKLVTIFPDLVQKTKGPSKSSPSGQNVRYIKKRTKRLRPIKMRSVKGTSTKSKHTPDRASTSTERMRVPRHKSRAQAFGTTSVITHDRISSDSVDVLCFFVMQVFTPPLV